MTALRFAKWVTALWVVFLPSTLGATPPNWAEYCQPTPRDQGTQLVCALSKSTDVSPIKVGSAMALASIQMTGTFCNFRYSQKTAIALMKVEADPEVSKVMKFLISSYRGKPPPGFSGDEKVFCKLQYELFGPGSAEKLFK